MRPFFLCVCLWGICVLSPRELLGKDDSLHRSVLRFVDKLGTPYRVEEPLHFLSNRSLRWRNRYVVRFVDKLGTPYRVEEPLHFLSNRSLRRRKQRGIPPTIQDLPPNPDYVNRLRSIGMEVYFTSRWLNAALVQCSAQEAAQAEAFPYVASVVFIAPGTRLKPSQDNSYVLPVLSAPLIEDSLSVPLNYLQNSMLGMVDTQKLGLQAGKNILIAVTDAGFKDVDTSPYFYELYRDHRVLDTYDFVTNTAHVYKRDKHGTSVLSTMAAKKVGEFIGTAPQASYALYITEDTHTEYRIEEYNWILAAERADSLGADIIHTSLGYKNFDADSMNYSLDRLNGSYALISRATQWAEERGILIVAAMGNDGKKGIGAPADSPYVLSVAALDPMGNRTDFSSIGPIGPPHTKPDVSALGLFTVCVSSSRLTTESGTSLAAPLISGLAATLWQMIPWADTQEITELLKQSADQADHPDHLRGYGLPNLKKACLLASRKLIWQASHRLSLEEDAPLLRTHEIIHLVLPDSLGKVASRVELRLLDTQGKVYQRLQELPFMEESYFLLRAKEPALYILEARVFRSESHSSLWPITSRSWVLLRSMDP